MSFRWEQEWRIRWAIAKELRNSRRRSEGVGGNEAEGVGSSRTLLPGNVAIGANTKAFIDVSCPSVAKWAGAFEVGAIGAGEGEAELASRDGEVGAA